VICRDGELDGGSPYSRDASAIAELPDCMQPSHCERCCKGSGRCDPRCREEQRDRCCDPNRRCCE
jgi:hypothetical protein